MRQKKLSLVQLPRARRSLPCAVLFLAAVLNAGATPPDKQPWHGPPPEEQTPSPQSRKPPPSNLDDFFKPPADQEPLDLGSLLVKPKWDLEAGIGWGWDGLFTGFGFPSLTVAASVHDGFWSWAHAGIALLGFDRLMVMPGAHYTFFMSGNHFRINVRGGFVLVIGGNVPTSTFADSNHVGFYTGFSLAWYFNSRWGLVTGTDIPVFLPNWSPSLRPNFYLGFSYGFL